MSTPDFDITPHVQMWQKFMRYTGIATVLVGLLVTVVVAIITA